MSSQSVNAESQPNKDKGNDSVTSSSNLTVNKTQCRRSQKRHSNLMLLDPKDFSGETTEMNGQLFQSVEESKDATQYVKTLEALERYAFKTYTVDLSSLFQRDGPETPELEIPKKPSERIIE